LFVSTNIRIDWFLKGFYAGDPEAAHKAELEVRDAQAKVDMLRKRMPSPPSEIEFFICC
jgi:hypothetical protein